MSNLSTHLDRMGQEFGFTPPRDGLHLNRIRQKYGLRSAATLRLCRRHKLRCGVGPYLAIRKNGDRERRKGLLVSRRDLAATIQTTPLPHDGVPLNQLARELGIHSKGLERWCVWDPHPAIGRKLQSGFGEWNGGPRKLWTTLVSRADAAACVEALRSPLHRPFHGQPGIWIAEGIYRWEHDNVSDLAFTDRYIEEHYEVREENLRGFRKRGRLHRLELVYPTPSRTGAWKVVGTWEKDLKGILSYRAGVLSGGGWLVEGELWRDEEGLWFSSFYIARQLVAAGKLIPASDEKDDLSLCAGRALSKFRETGVLTRYKEVPRNWTKRRGVPPIVHHESEVGPLLGLPSTGQATVPTTLPTATPTNGNGNEEVQSPAPPVESGEPIKSKKRPGRTTGWRDPSRADRNEQMVKAWEDGRFESVTAMGKAFHVSRARARQILEAAGASLIPPSKR